MCQFPIEQLNNYDINLSMKRKQFTTTLREDYLKKVKILAIEQDKSVNDLLEEALEWLLKKYKKMAKD